MKKWTAFLPLVWLFCFLPNAFAITVETEKFRLGINGYINSTYLYHSEMPMDMGGMVMEMDDISTFETDANLILNATRDKFRANLNLEMDNGVSIHHDETIGKFNLLEVFGEYGFNEYLRVRLGQFLTPFGIFNQTRFVTSLFAPVVLPMMYQPPMNYPGHSLVAPAANAMVFGSFGTNGSLIDYYVYVGNGEQDHSGKDENKDKGYGGRLMVSIPGFIQVGGSYYSNEEDPVDEGVHSLMGADLQIMFHNLTLQGEVVHSNKEKEGDGLSYYGRLTYNVHQFSPFIGFDFLEDKESLIYSGGQERYSVGTGYRAFANVILKTEYHFHHFRNSDNFMGAPDDINMFRAAAIFIF